MRHAQTFLAVMLGGAVVYGLGLSLPAEAQTTRPPFVLLDDSPPVVTGPANQIVCYGPDGANASPQAQLQNTLVNDGIVLIYATRQMHLIEQAQVWHGFVWLRDPWSGQMAWVLVTYPAGMCSYYPDPAREAVEGHYWIDSVN